MAKRNQKSNMKRKQEFMTINEVTNDTPDRKTEFAFREEQEVIEFLKHSPVLYSRYQGLDEEWRKRFLDFCSGKKTLPLTYDPFFKRIFHPDIHPDRLSKFISGILEINVRVLRILPNEDSVMDGESLLIMDLLGELDDGSLVNIEIQKQGYAFPAERISCYGADLLLRQYARVKGERGRAFTYRDIKKVYVIVIFEKSTGEFHDVPEEYLHHGKIRFNTGLSMEFLQEYFLVALDVFREIPYPKDRSQRTAWLSLLATEDLKDAEKVVGEYPWLEEIYEEIAMLRQRPEEVLGMFSEALRILDQNTLKYMIEELQKEMKEQKEQLETAIEEKDAFFVELAKKDAKLAERDSELAKKDAALEARDNEIAELKRLLKQYEGK